MDNFENKNVIESQENSQEEIEKKENKINEDLSKMFGNKEKQKEINKAERIEETFWELEGKKFWEWDKIEFMYMNENWEKLECSLDIDSQTLEINWDEYEIELPSWATLTNIEFSNWEILLKWKIWFFSWEWKASYWKMLNSLDETVNNWRVKILTDSWKTIEINRVT